MEPLASKRLKTTNGIFFITRPTLEDDISTCEELETRAADIFKHFQDGRLELRSMGIIHSRKHQVLI